ncbi:MAG: hypothetical protein HRT43_09765 [Campylobacteraceae bacterium]|nr:hypothetical protein [Campylobacteraceae bacterium]
MSKILMEQLNSFEHYRFDESSRNITNVNMTDSDVGEFLEIIYLLDSKFMEYNILHNFNIAILNKR